MCKVDVQGQLRGFYTLQRCDHEWWHWIIFHVIDITIVNSYIMYKAHMTQLGKLAETISHLKFNVALARALVKKGNHFTPKAITMLGACILNP